MAYTDVGNSRDIGTVAGQKRNILTPANLDRALPFLQ